MSDTEPKSPQAGGADGAPKNAASGVKIYDRPERTGISPTVLVIGVIILIILAFVLYKVFVH